MERRNGWFETSYMPAGLSDVPTTGFGPILPREVPVPPLTKKAITRVYVEEVTRTEALTRRL